MPKATVNGIDLYYAIEGRGPAVVFCHGAGGNHMSWWQQVPEFSRRFRCITFDHRGFGQSLNTSGGHGAEAFADDLAALLDCLGLGEVFLVAQSMGGRTVLNFAKRFPGRVTAMVMAGTVANIRTPELDQMRKELRQRLPEDRRQLSLADRVWEERPHLAYLYQLIRMRNPPRPPRFLWRDNVPGTTAEEVAKLQAPALFLVGEEDRICPAPMVATAFRLFPSATILQVPETGHSVYFERPALFNATVMDFFGKLV